MKGYYMVAETFDVFFCFRDTELSKGIRIMTNSEFSHTAYVKWENGKLYVADAQKDGFTLKEFAEWKQKYGYDFVALRHPSITSDFINKGLIRESKILGKKYDFVSTFIRKPRNIIVRVLNNFTRKQRPEWKQLEGTELNRLFCSEATAYVMQLDNIDLTPQEVFNALTLQGWKQVKIEL